MNRRTSYEVLLWVNQHTRLVPYVLDEYDWLLRTLKRLHISDRHLRVINKPFQIGIAVPCDPLAIWCAMCELAELGYPVREVMYLSLLARA